MEPRSKNNAFYARFFPLKKSGARGIPESGAGSDLASLQTRAVKEAENYIVNGQKTWTTYGMQGDWIFCLVRTDPDVKKQAGISFLLVDMKSPGLTLSPIVNITTDVDFCEVFFDDVVVPESNRVGSPGEGWTIANTVLAHERGVNLTFLRYADFLESIAAQAKKNATPRPASLR